MFGFVLRYFAWLKDIPLFPQVFDAMLKMQMLWRQPEVLDWIDDLEQEFLAWDQVDVSSHRYGGLQFNIAGKELGHLHSNGLMDILFSVKLKKEILDQGRAEDHHVFKKSGWISFYIRDLGDKAYALELLRMAYLRRML